MWPNAVKPHTPNGLGVFVTGTDTGVGKTIVSAWLCMHWQAHYFKPIQSGLIEPTDTDTVRAISLTHCISEIYRLQAPLSPHLSAALDDIEIDLHHVAQPDVPRLVVEGAGGVNTPINQHQTLLDVMHHLGWPVLLVARSGLGTINHTTLSLAALRARGLPVLGVVVQGPPNPDNIKAIEHFGQCQVLATLPQFDVAHQSNIQSDIESDMARTLRTQLAQHLMPEALQQALANARHRSAAMAMAMATATATPKQNNPTAHWQARDAKVCWHPFTQAQTAAPPLVISHGRGEWLYSTDGNAYFDAASSWWVNVHGHANPELAQAVASQAHTLEHTLFAGLTHAPAVQLAEQLIAASVPNMARVFYSDNGSTAVEVALKMAFQYWHNQCQYFSDTKNSGTKNVNTGKNKNRHRLLAAQGGYHGDTFGAMAAGHSSGFYGPFKPWLFEVDTIPFGTCECTETHALQMLDEYLQHHGHACAAFIIEPLVQGAAGMRMMRAAHLAELIKRCQAHGILVIFDEVFTGFYRTGTLFAAHQVAQHGVFPDMMCLSKGLTGGMMPMGATLCSQAIFDGFLGDHVQQALLHGHSYTANPLACSAALKSLELLQRPNVQTQIAKLAEVHDHWLPILATHRSIQNPRQCGTIAAFEIVIGEQLDETNNKPTPKPLRHDYGGKTSQWLRQELMRRGILARPIGNTVYWVPPYCTQPDVLHKAYAAILELLTNTPSDTKQNETEFF